MKKLLIIFTVIIFSNALFAQIVSYPVNNQNKIIKIKQYPIVYYLPKTNLLIDIDVTTKHFIPGPFANYAEKYLLIKNVKEEEETNSYISNVNISEYSLADETKVFIAMDENFKIELNDLGILSAYNQRTTTENISFPLKSNTKEIDDYNTILFTNISVNSNFYNKADTTYEVIQIDSVFEKIPIIKKKIQSKSLEQKAEEAADFILKLRNSRYQIQSGDFETDYPPANANDLIEELNSLEKTYLELFIGKNIEIKKSYHFEISPTKEENILLGYISETKGFVAKEENNTQEINLNIQSLKTISKLTEIFNQETITKQQAGLYYLNPELCNISLNLDDEVVAEKKILLPQLGMLNFLPQKLFSNKNIKIIFNTNTGAIKSIFNE